MHAGMIAHIKSNFRIVNALSLFILDKIIIEMICGRFNAPNLLFAPLLATKVQHISLYKLYYSYIANDSYIIM